MSVNSLLLTLLWASISTVICTFPIGVNLPPLGGAYLTSSYYGSVNWTPTSTNVFIDIFKHCSTPLLIKKVSFYSFGLIGGLFVNFFIIIYLRNLL